jgi:hypothetical protein
MHLAEDSHLLTHFRFAVTQQLHCTDEETYVRVLNKMACWEEVGPVIKPRCSSPVKGKESHNQVHWHGRSLRDKTETKRGVLTPKVAQDTTE